MTTEPEEKHTNRWPIIAVFVSIIALVVTLIVGVHFSSTSGSSPDANRPTSVDTKSVLIDMIDFKYQPANISVPLGATVTWANDDKIQHTATEKDRGAWDTQVVHEDESAKLTFNSPGTYTYYCTIHPYMIGKLTVRSS